MRAAPRLLSAALAGAVALAAASAHAQAPRPGAPGAPAAPAAPAALSGPQLEALVEPLAGVPQAILPAVLDACRQPAEVMAAATALAQAEPAIDPRWHTAVQYLARYAPDVLGVLAQDIRATAALGEAYARQPNDVWRAFGAVEMRARAAQPAPQPAAPAPRQAAQPATPAPARAATPAPATAAAPAPAPTTAAPAAAAPAPPPCNAYGSPMRGAARGAARGAVVGAISENAGRGAAIGAATGGVAGAARRGSARRAGVCS